MSDDPASIAAWQEEENWCKKNGWDLLTYLRGKPVIITKDALGQAVPDYKATEVVRTLTKQHQERCEMAADEIEHLRKRLLGEENAYDIMRLENEHLQTDRNNLALEVERLNACIERLRAERNEARWEVCELSSNGSIDDATRISVERGWDCFKENTNG